MNTLNWQPVSNAPHDDAAPTPDPARISSTNGDPWFAVAMGLVGLIAGYLIAIF